MFVSPSLVEAHLFTGEELFSLVVGAAAGAPDDRLEPLATVWVMNGSTGAKRCAIATDTSFATSGPLPVAGARGIEGQVTVTDETGGCLGQTAHANDRIVVELGFACTAESVAPVSASAVRGGQGAALGSGSNPDETAGLCDHPGYLQVDGGLVFSGAAGANPCDPAGSTIAINSRRLTSVTVDSDTNQATDATLTDPQGLTHHYHYEYDTRGALQSKVELDAPPPSGVPVADPTTYQYDEFGNLRHVALPEGTTIDYLIDAANRRVGRTVTTAQGSTTQRFLYQGGLRPAAEVDGSGDVIAFFVYGDKSNAPEYMEKSGQRYRLVTDHLGSIRVVVNTGTGEIAQRMDYDEHGNVLADSAPGFQPFGYAGGLSDQYTGLVRFGARDYDSTIGRWTAPDPWGFGGRSANLMSYVNGDPINLIDPTGRQPTTPLPPPLTPTEGPIAAPLPPVGSAAEPNDCDYYPQIAERFGCAYHGSRYWLGGAQFYCANPRANPCFLITSDETLNTIRRCLITEDKNALENPALYSSAKPPCPSATAIRDYHLKCFAESGYWGICFPSWWTSHWFLVSDGN